MKIQELKERSNKRTAPNELDLIIAHFIEKSREFVISHPEFKLEEKQISDIFNAIEERASGKPIAYITGKKEFYGLNFSVDEHTLIPRPETELIVETIVELTENAASSEKNLFWDVGTGSGAIIISLAKSLENRNNLSFCASDISQKALNTAKINAERHGVDSKIDFFHGSLLEPRIENINNIRTFKHIVIAANLPYLSEEIYNDAPIDVKNFEPKSALTSGKDGFDHYRELLNQIKSLKNAAPEINLTLVAEISPEQKAIAEKELSKTFNNAKATFHKDLTGRWRIFEVTI